MKRVKILTILSNRTINSSHAAFRNIFVDSIDHIKYSKYFRISNPKELQLLYNDIKDSIPPYVEL